MKFSARGGELGPAVNLVLFAILVGIAAWLVWRKGDPKEAESVSTLVGALIGAAAILLGNAVNGFGEEAARSAHLGERRTSLKALITAELVGIAVDLLSGKRQLDAALEQLRSTGSQILGLDLGANFPRELQLTMSLGAELLILEQSELEVLVTLQQHLAITRADLRESAQGAIGFLRLSSLADGIGHTMEVLADCFERLAPTRRLKLGPSDPVLASVMLREGAGRHRGPPS
jgi:hypothetical protein